MKLLTIVIIAVGIAVSTIVFFLLKVYFNNRIKIVERLTDIKETKQAKKEDDPFELPFKERIIIPVIKKVQGSIMKLAPYSLKIREQQLLKQAGYPNNLSFQEWMVRRMIIWLLLGGLLTFYALNQGSLVNKFLISAIGWVLGYMAPIFYLKRKMTTRQKEIESGLPYVLDILTVSVEAGLGFDAALVKVVDKTRGSLSSEFQKTMHEIKMGKSRKESLKDLGERTGVEDMIQFVGSVIQAEQLGVRMGQVLRVQSEDMRQKRKQRAEEKAMKAPIKILFPLILFIFPTIFIIILGPAIINIIDTLF